MNKKTILCVDDEPEILNSLSRALRLDKYNILTATSAMEALKVIEEHHNQINLIISDQRMPEVTGVEFFLKIKTAHPNIIRVILSGYTDSMEIIDAINKANVFKFLSKPWNDDELRKTIRECLSHEQS